eukprot:7265667-Pyramimonas_sp.AAC.1
MMCTFAQVGGLEMRRAGRRREHRRSWYSERGSAARRDGPAAGIKFWTPPIGQTPPFRATRSCSSSSLFGGY